MDWKTQYSIHCHKMSGYASQPWNFCCVVIISLKCMAGLIRL